MKYAVMALVMTSWTCAAVFYRLAGKRELPRNHVSLGAAGAWFALTVVTGFVTGASPMEAPPALFAVGAVAGVCVAAALPLFMGAVARGNLAVSWTILTLSFAASALLSMVYPGCEVNAAGVAGLAAAGAAIVVLGRTGAKQGAKAGFKPGWGLFITLAFFANTATMYVYPLAGKWAGIETVSNKVAFLLAETAVFLAGSIIFSVLSLSPNAKQAIVVGLGVGSALAVGNYASMVALGDMAVAPYVFFPATTGGATITVALISAVVFREQPGLWGWIGLALGVTAMLLLGAAA